MQAPLIPCPHCKASVPILDARGATCVFCLKAVLVPASPDQPPAHGHLKRAVSSQLATIRGAKPRVPFDLVALLVFIAGTGACAYAVADQHLGEDFFSVLLAMAAASVASAAAALFRGRHWRRATVPPAHVRAEGELYCLCRRCSTELPTPGRVVMRCPACRSKNLLPAPLVRTSAHAAYREMLLCRRGAMSPQTARVAAATYRTEFIGWLLISLASVGACAWLWATQGTLGETFPMLRDPVGQIGVPAFLAAVLGGFGLYDAIGSRVQRTRVQRAPRTPSY